MPISANQYPIVQKKISEEPLKVLTTLRKATTTHHNKALTHRDLHPEKCPLSRLSLGLCPTHNNQHIRQNQIMRKQKQNNLEHWKYSTKKQSKLACFLSLNRDYTVAEYLTTVIDPKRRKSLTRHRLSEHSLATEKGRHRQPWLPGDDTQNQLETELHFVTSCQSHEDIRDTHYPRITKACTDFKDTPDAHKLPYLLGETV